MEQQNLEEQPLPMGQDDVTDNQEAPIEQGSSIGKFKDAESLLEAYNNLQAEFTRKCQKLAQYEKENLPPQPVYKDKDWQQKVSDFLASHCEAKPFASEISQKILENPSIYNGENALNLAWAEIISKKYRPVEQLVNDDKFIEDYVLSNEQIRQKVLSNYIADLERNKLPPIQTSHTGKYTFPTQKVANNLSEAKYLVEQLLK